MPTDLSRLPAEIAWFVAMIFLWFVGLNLHRSEPADSPWAVPVPRLLSRILGNPRPEGTISLRGLGAQLAAFLALALELKATALVSAQAYNQIVGCLVWPMAAVVAAFVWRSWHE